MLTIARNSHRLCKADSDNSDDSTPSTGKTVEDALMLVLNPLNMAKYFMFWATYNENNHGEDVTLDVEGYISSEFFPSEEEMERFLEGYYDPSVIFTEVSSEEMNLTYDEVKALNGEGFDPEWFKGRTSLFEWVKSTWPDGYKEEYFSGRQPKIAQFVSWA